MKLRLTVFLALFSIALFGQRAQTVDLVWKIGDGDSLTYATVMSDIDAASIEVNFGQLFNSPADDPEGGSGDMSAFFQKFNEAFGNLDYVTTLTNGDDGVVNIVMTTQPNDDTQPADIASADSEDVGLLETMHLMTGGIVLRGSVYETGSIHSFWLKNNQKNLVALFFQLPTSPVSTGDKWALDVNLISNDANFKCDSSYRVNEATLADIKEVNGETIAVIQYNIVEYVSGEFSMPAFLGGGGKSETEMDISYQGIAEFSIDQGHWVAYDGIMSMKTKGVMTTDKKTKFTLIKE
ncbi:hypothetical protein [Lewinella sp. IMCC34191]|uniref:hypothetical protein n=1 Tax=Lewinella sp. IMCC34191 TaxID=2259172 RepID=UPI001300AA71|nr:hypothetical protein [Lewinella sp. IMCC34191]